MKKLLILTLLLSISLFASTLDSFISKANNLYTKGEVPSSNFVRLKPYSRLRSEPVVKKDNVVKILNDDTIFLIQSCKNRWCKLFDQNLYVYQTRLIKK